MNAPMTSPLHAREAGSGEPALLLLHAFPLNSRMWESQMSALSKRTRVIAPDFPGFGVSAPFPGRPTLEDFAASVMAVLDRSGIDRVIPVGLSMGGYVAFRLIERLGARMAGLVLANTRATPDTEQGAKDRRSSADDIEAQGVHVAADRFLPKLIGAATQRDHPEILAAARRLIEENTAAGVAGAQRAMSVRPDSTPLLRTVQCPVLCLGSEEDVLMAAEIASEMAALAPRGRAEIFKGIGHLSNLEAPDLFNGALARFLDECA